jgi:hypothetical protein
VWSEMCLKVKSKLRLGVGRHAVLARRIPTTRQERSGTSVHANILIVERYPLKVQRYSIDTHVLLEVISSYSQERHRKQRSPRDLTAAGHARA